MSHPAVKELLLIRHGAAHPVANAEAADPDLTPDGVRQAKLLAELLASGIYGPVTALVSSTMRRAVQTAAPIADALHLEIELDERLVEFDHGWTQYGLTLDAYPSRAAAYAAMNSGRWGEHTFDPEAFQARVTDAIEAAIARHRTGSIAVVCHGGVISAYLGTILGASRPLFFAPDYTSVTRIMLFDDGHRELRSASETTHLHRTPPTVTA